MPKTKDIPVVQITGNQVVVRIPKAMLVMTKAQFLDALRLGKAYQRRKAYEKRLQEKDT